MVKIHFGSTNKTKIDATIKAFSTQEKYSQADVFRVDVAVEEFGHPKDIEETI